MDYTAFGFAGLCVVVSLVCVVIAAHRGGTMKLNLPFVSFAGDGLALTPAVRALFVVLAFAVLGVAVLWIRAVGVPDNGGTSQASGTPTATATVTVPADESDRNGDQQTGGNGADDNGSADDGTGPENADTGKLVEVWSDCPFELHLETVLAVDSDSCPVVTEDSADIMMSYNFDDGGAPVVELAVDSNAYVTDWENTSAPSPEQCRDKVEAGGIRGGQIWIDEDSVDQGVCLRTSSGDRYVYLRMEEITIEVADVYTVTGTATAWDVREP